jgi:hypothetical protein
MTEKMKTTRKEEKASLREMKVDLEKAQELETAKPKGVKMVFIENTKKIKNRVNKEVVNHSKTVEKWHKRLASWPLDQLANFDSFERVAEDLNAIQAKIIKNNYDLMRLAVSKTDEIADEILIRAEKLFQAA